MSSAARPSLMRALVLASVFGASPFSHLAAHEKKTALTDVFYNERTGNLEVAHRFSLHDAEHALRKAAGLDADLSRSAKARGAFAKYVAERFKLRSRDGAPLKLTLLGQELERGFLWVYQETKIPEPASAPFIIENTVLHDVVKGQVNTVNVRFRSEVSTFVFEADTGRRHYPGPAGPAREDDGARAR